MSHESFDPLATFDLTGQVAVVTGAPSGLGDRFARVLHAGASVVLAARRRDRLEVLAAALPGALAVVADLSLPADRERVIADAVERFGGVQVLVNNAGIGHTVAVEDEDLETFRARWSST